MQDTLGNLLGGIVLQLDGSMREGDWVEIDTVRGRVTDVRWRYTAIETRNRETVYVPNSALMKNRFTVLGSRFDPEPRWRRWVWFTIELGVPATRVSEVLERAVHDAEIPLVASNPAPGVVLMDVTLPDASGFDVARRIKTREASPFVVLLSFHDSHAARLEAWAAGADGFVAKSETTTRLMPLVLELLGRKKVGSERDRTVPTTRQVASADLEE